MDITPSSSLPTTTTTTTSERALVLGGGGSSGNAWSIGVVAGLYDSGLDVTGADLTIGTSAGSTTAVQLAGATPADLYAGTLAAAPPRRTEGVAPTRPAANHRVAEHLERFRAIIAASENLADMRRRTGAAALAREESSEDSWPAQWRAIVASRLPIRSWPERAMLITAVDARTGEPVAFDRDSGVDLTDAVAASCAGGGLPYRIGGIPYIDGGYRANAENADLAAGHARVLVLSPLGGRTLHPPEWGTRLAVQVDELREHGSRVETIVPDPDVEHLFGGNAMDLSLRGAAARAGHEQGQALAEQLTELWG